MGEKMSGQQENSLVCAPFSHPAHLKKFPKAASPVICLQTRPEHPHNQNRASSYTVRGMNL